MKFGKSLSNQIEETLPEWRDKFLSYKELKKCLKRIRPAAGVAAGAPTTAYIDPAAALPPAKRARVSPTPSPPPPAAADAADDGERADPHARPPAAAAASSSSSSSPASAEPGVAGAGTMSEEEADFIRLLEAELDKFNTFFVEKEEEYVIHLKELQDSMSEAAEADFSEELMMKIRKEIVDFHGEMVLLENYSALNYTGLVKILKKYDKRTGALLRLPFIQKVLKQPFFTTDLLYKLVKECETMLDSLFPAKETLASVPKANEAVETQDAGQASGPSTARVAIPELEEIEYIESLYMKSTVAALRALKEIRKGSSTVSVFSLPPLQLNNGVEDKWDKIPPPLEQEAK